MGLHVEGLIGRDELEEFIKLCGERGWVVLGTPSKDHTRLTYLDGTMTKRTVLIGDETAAWVQGH